MIGRLEVIVERQSGDVITDISRHLTKADVTGTFKTKDDCYSPIKYDVSGLKSPSEALTLY